jgi:hypothetical protein
VCLFLNEIRDFLFFINTLYLVTLSLNLLAKRKIGAVVSSRHGKCILVVIWIEDFYLLQKKACLNFIYKIV